MIKTSRLKFNQLRDRMIYSVGMSLTNYKLTIEDEMFLTTFYKHDKIGLNLFDLFNEYLVVCEHSTKKNIEYLYGKVYDFCMVYDEYEYALVMDNVFFHNDQIRSPEICTCILNFVAMIDSFYGDGVVDYIDHKSKKVVRADIYPGSIATLIDLSSYCMMRMEYTTANKLSFKQGVCLNDLISSKSNYSLTQVVLGKSLVDALLMEKRPTEIQKHAQNTSSNYFVINGSGHYKTSPSPFVMYTALPCLWDRENFNENSDVATTSSLLIDFCKKDIFKYRSVMLREKGVIIRRKDNSNLFDKVRWICMREDHCIERDIHNIVVDMFLEDDYSVRELVIDIKDTHSSKVNMLYGIDVVCFGLLQVILGVNNTDKYDIEIIKNAVKGPEYFDEFMYYAEDSVNKINEMFKEEGLVYEEPSSWNDYVKSGKKRNNSKGEVLFTVMESIGNYTRKLPIGQKASDSAVQLAKDHYMDLSDDKTFVSEFTRKRNITTKIKE